MQNIIVKIRYARVITQQQNLDRQLTALEAESCDLVGTVALIG
jgi:DNA invertase Pin-like site-specific DNA recombinase